MKVKQPRTKITKRVISKILGRRVEGWNDKNESTNRIKLTERLTYREMSQLESELTYSYPEYRFAIGNICWRAQGQYKRIATAITFWK